MKEYLYEGKNEEELILKMLNELGVKEDEILYVKKEETVGLLKKKKVTIKAILKTDVLEYSKKFVTDLVNAMGLDVKLETKRGENNILIKLYSDNNPILIGKNGRTLMSIQNILHQSIYAKTGIHVNILLDASCIRITTDFLFFTVSFKFSISFSFVFAPAASLVSAFQSIKDISCL